MPTQLPSSKTALLTLLQADFTTQWRNRRSVILALLVPAILLFSWKGIISKLGGPFALSMSINIGLISLGLMGYANNIARDRDKGVFQRLRAAPVAAWQIMVSRLLVQLCMILLLTFVVFIMGYQYDHVVLSAAGYVLATFVSLIGGAVYLSLGQLIVGRVKNPETVNSTTRLVYIGFIIIGMFGEMGQLGEQVQKLVHWSPYGAVKTLMAYSMNPGPWTSDNTLMVLCTLGYVLVFATLGIKWFKWSTR